MHTAQDVAHLSGLSRSLRASEGLGAACLTRRCVMLWPKVRYDTTLPISAFAALTHLCLRFRLTKRRLPASRLISSLIPQLHHRPSGARGGKRRKTRAQ